MKTFYITSDYIELIRLLKAAGPYSSPEEVKRAITDGRVTVNDEIETRKKCKILPGQLVVAGALKIMVKIGR